MQNRFNPNETLAEPIRPAQLPLGSQWLAGEGAGSWFYFEVCEPYIKISRFSPLGKLECSGNFKIINDKTFHISRPFRIAHLSHCQTVRVIQDHLTISFERIR